MHDSRIEAITEKVLADRRIDDDEALLLFEAADLSTLGALADHVRWRLHPEPLVTYIVDRNVNPTNVCVTDCGFCAFYRRPGHEESYVLPRETIYAKVQELVDLGGVLVLMQGGHHPYLKADWFAELLRDLKQRFPLVHLHAMSPPEIHHLSKLGKCSVESVLQTLIDAGLDSIPGGGAEILSDRVRKIIAPKKCTADEWIDVSRRAHRLGLRTTATMMYGHFETLAERVEHLQRLRNLQDETGGFTAFACWNFQKGGTPLAAAMDRAHEYGPGGEMTTPAEYLRTVAIARIYLDNIRNIQASYVTQGLEAAQMSLRYGVNDFGGGMMEENVVSAAGCMKLSSLEEIERNITEAGFTPKRRNFFYEILDPSAEMQTA
ncbi:MAG: dehypoxanthine futalosine cyclase [Planctomycetes bacterium]|nr:dehypoxanthine futalosine cyclase [Planctomycetota bacterium]